MIVIGVDSGGTSMRATVYRDGVARERTEGPGVPMRTGRGEAVATAIAGLVRPMLLKGRAVRADALVVGAAGAGRSAEQFELQSALDKERIAWRTIVTTDAELARAAAFGGAPGVLLIAGTGSIAVSRDEAGQARRIGGLGWRMGDQGSAYWIGEQALRAVGAMHDGTGTVTHLAEALCTAASVPGIAGLIQWSTMASPVAVAALAPAVLVTAAAGDPVAAAVRDRAVGELAELAVAAGGRTLPVVLAGGLLGADRPLHEPVATRLETAFGMTVLRKAIDPCRGALVLAAPPGRGGVR